MPNKEKVIEVQNLVEKLKELPPNALQYVKGYAAGIADAEAKVSKDK